MIREATPDDVPVLAGLVADLALRGPLGPAVVEREIARALADDRSVLLVADVADAVVGYVLGAVLPMPVSGGMAFVQELYVLPAHRRRGLATALMTEVERRAREAGVGVVGVATSRAATLYGALGFEPVATWFRRALA